MDCIHLSFMKFCTELLWMHMAWVCKIKTKFVDIGTCCQDCLTWILEPNVIELGLNLGDLTETKKDEQPAQHPQTKSSMVILTP